MNFLTKGLSSFSLINTRAVLAMSTALILFGALDVLGPQHGTSGSPLDTSTMAPNRATVPPEHSVHNGPVRQGAAQRVTAQQVAAQRVAIEEVAARFVTACDTTDPAQPQGDQAAEAALAPGLVSHTVVEPAAMSTGDRATTVSLDAPGQPVPGRGGTVAVIVTGTMSVTSDASPLQRVPIVERVTLRPRSGVPITSADAENPRATSGWQVVGVEVGA